MPDNQYDAIEHLDFDVEEPGSEFDDYGIIAGDRAPALRSSLFQNSLEIADEYSAVNGYIGHALIGVKPGLSPQTSNTYGEIVDSITRSSIKLEMLSEPQPKWDNLPEGLEADLSSYSALVCVLRVNHPKLGIGTFVVEAFKSGGCYWWFSPQEDLGTEVSNHEIRNTAELPEFYTSADVLSSLWVLQVTARMMLKALGVEARESAGAAEEVIRGVILETICVSLKKSKDKGLIAPDNDVRITTQMRIFSKIVNEAPILTLMQLGVITPKFLEEQVNTLGFVNPASTIKNALSKIKDTGWAEISSERLASILLLPEAVATSMLDWSPDILTSLTPEPAMVRNEVLEWFGETDATYVKSYVDEVLRKAGL